MTVTQQAQRPGEPEPEGHGPEPLGPKARDVKARDEVVPEVEEWEELLAPMLGHGSGGDPEPTTDVEHTVGNEVGSDAVTGVGLSLAETSPEGLSRAEASSTPGSPTPEGLSPDLLLRAALTRIGMDEESAAGWARILCAKVAVDGTEGPGVPVPTTDAEVIGVLKLMASTGSSLEASALITVQDLVLRAASQLLASRGTDDPSSMSKTARRAWRAQVKAAVAGELQVALGIGVVEARQMVAVGTSPGAIRHPLLGAMHRGEVCWRLVREFQRTTRRLTVDQAARVAVAMFGTDAARAAVERLDPDGNLELGRPWHHAEYYDALAREIAHVKDEDEAEADRAAALEARDTRLDLEDDGTATFSCTTSLAAGIAIAQRIDGAARRARKGGDPRTLAQLRSDITASLLIHGTISMLGIDSTGTSKGECSAESPGESASESSRAQDGSARHGLPPELADEIITADDIEALRAVIAATPPGHIDLVVPWDPLVGAVCAHCRAPVVPTSTSPPPGHQDTGGSSASDPPSEPQPAGHAHQRCGAACDLSPVSVPGAGSTSSSSPAQDTGQTSDSGSDSGSGQDTGQTSDSGSGRDPGFASDAIPVQDAGPLPSLVGDQPISPGVGELVGWPASFVSAREARRILLTPGTRLSRILMDPADGRCIERTIGSYAPDADMKRQVRAADVYGRGPGSRRPARECEIDHEKEWLISGWTAEPNLNCKACLDHFRKTKKLWRSTMNLRRDVTWTTLLKQVTTTRGHDYRQYLARFDQLAPYDPDDAHHEGVPVSDRSDLADRRDLANQLLYAAIVHRDPTDRAEAEDDIVGSEDWLGLGDWAHLHHRDENGRRRSGPPSRQETPEQVLGLEADLGLEKGGTAGPASEATPSSPTPWSDTIRDRPRQDPPPF